MRSAQAGGGAEGWVGGSVQARVPWYWRLRGVDESYGDVILRWAEGEYRSTAKNSDLALI
jgi:hypothetical protein